MEHHGDVHAASGCLMRWFAGTEWWVGGGVGGQQRCSACPPEVEEKSLKMSVKFPFLSGKGWTGISHLKKKDLAKDSLLKKSSFIEYLLAPWFLQV